MSDSVVAVKPSLLDRTITYFSPVRGAQRMLAKEMMALGGGYIGADKGRRSLMNWITGGGSADADTLSDLPALREHSRDLIRNTPMAAGAVSTIVTSVVGSGLTLQCAIDRELLNLTDEQADAWESATEREFNHWALNCDLRRTLNFYDMQELAFRQMLENGDVFTVLSYKKRPGDLYGLKLSMVEADRVCNENDALDTDKCSGGIQRDDDGAPEYCHILKHHPGNSTYQAKEWDKIPFFGAETGRRNVIHFYNMLRPDQSRGVPLLAPVVEPLKQLSKLTEAELMAAVISSLFTVFIKTENGQGIPGLSGAPAPGPIRPGAPALTKQAPDKDKQPIAMGSGLIVDLAEGESIETANPNRPNGAFEPFFLAIVKEVSVGIEMPYEIVLKVFNKSYSASRGAINEAWRMYLKRRAKLSRGYCDLVYFSWLDEAVASGRRPAPGYFANPLIRQAYLGARWHGPGKGQINELVEAKAVRERTDIGLTSMTEEKAGYDGGDALATHQQRRKEVQRRVDDGLQEPVVAQQQKQEETVE
ncbi:phage portal protein [uncultured Desulfuromusa sp.]|uniref:phage portal protein n=1 Tax=uncultured Desulfuromusa sp. TaxID=219183 RepID=UPI002AA9465C|nr:phage portal protein [uncultured Desulfuromusa sp.]